MKIQTYIKGFDESVASVHLSLSVKPITDVVSVGFTDFLNDQPHLSLDNIDNYFLIDIASTPNFVRGQEKAEEEIGFYIGDNFFAEDLPILPKKDRLPIGKTFMHSIYPDKNDFSFQAYILKDLLLPYNSSSNDFINGIDNLILDKVWLHIDTSQIVKTDKDLYLVEKCIPRYFYFLPWE